MRICSELHYTKQSWRYALMASASALAALALSAPAFAQDNADSDAESADQEESVGLGQIVVTAQKREEDMQRVPLAITSLGGEALARRVITDPGQLNGFAPGVSIQPSFILLTYIRGLGNYSSQPGVDQSVAYNVDDVYISKPYGMPPIIFDLERVEMLRGPQGTLQGRNAVAGSINFVTGKPEEDMAAKASVSYGNYDALRIDGMVNVPIAEGYALRVAGAMAEHDGYFDNGYGDQNVMGVRARFLASPTPEFEAIISAEYTKRDELGSTYSPCPPGSLPSQGCAGVEWDPWAGTPGQGTDAVLDQDEENILYSENRAIYAHVNYDVGLGTLTWVPNYREWEYRNHQSLSAAFGYAPAVNNKMHSQELRMASNPGSAFDWVFGVYYAKENAEEQNYFTSGLAPSVTIDMPNFRPIGNVYYKNDIFDYQYRSQSVFGQVTVPLMDAFRVSVGLRYTDDKKFQAGNSGIVLLDVNNQPYIESVDVEGRQSSKKLNYRAGVEFDVAPDAMLYANVSDGYKAGGVNGVPPNSDFPATFGPEEITAYQGGIKSRFLDDRLQINAEAFYYDYTGYQTSGFDVTDDGVLIGGTFNSQKARLYGGEIETAFAASPYDRLALSMTYLHAKYTEFDVPETGAFFTGQPLQNAPKFTMTGDYERTFDLSNGGEIVAHVQGQYQSSQWVDYRLTPGAHQSAWFRALADVTYTSPDRLWSLTAFVDNITNDDALLVANGGLGPYMLGTPYPPRTYGLRLGFNY